MGNGADACPNSTTNPYIDALVDGVAEVEVDHLGGTKLYKR